MDDKYTEEEEEARPSSQLDADSSAATIDSRPRNESECLRDPDESLSLEACGASIVGADAGEQKPMELSPVVGEGDGGEDAIRAITVSEPSESHRDGGEDSAREERDSVDEPIESHRDGGENSIGGERDSVAESSESSHDGGDNESEAPVQQSVMGERDSVVNSEETPVRELSGSGDDGGEYGMGEEKRLDIDDDGVTREEKREYMDGQDATEGEHQQAALEGDMVEKTEVIVEREETKPTENASLADLSDDREIHDDKMLANAAGFTEILSQDEEVPETAFESQETRQEHKGPSREVLVVGHEGDKDVADGEKRDEEDVADGVLNGEERDEEGVKDGVFNGESEMEQKAELGKEADDVERMEVAEMEEENIPEDSVVADTVEDNDAADGKASADVTEEKEAPEEKLSAVIVEEMGNLSKEKEVSPLAAEKESQQETEMSDVEEEEKGKTEETQVTKGAEEAELRAKDEAVKKEDTEMPDVKELREETVKVDEMQVTEIAEENELRTKDVAKKAEGNEMGDGSEGVKCQQDSSVIAIAERTESQEETVMADVGEEEPQEAEEVEEESRSIGAKRKRGRNSKVVKGSGKKAEEDVCFICFDGGELVLCDRRGCPKAYHPSCVGRDEAFFQSKGKWNCGWHLCSKCGKTAFYMCYTCTTSLCKGCIKDAVIFCVRGNKGLCETCMETIKLIENNEQEKKDAAQLDFDDKGSWEYLFKDYWTDLKNRLSITSEELARAKAPLKRHDRHSNKLESPNEHNDANAGGGSDSESPLKRRKTRRRLKSASANAKSSSTGESVEWASRELLDVVTHMRNGDGSFLPRSEVQNLLLDYIKRYNLRDPRRKSQVICDPRLQNLFGKSHVGHFEMLNLLDSHFHIREDTQADDLRGSVVGTEANLLYADESSDHLMKTVKDKRRKMRKKGGSRGRQSNLDDYAAIDMHNINLIYLKRNLVEDLMEDSTTFHDKVVGAFVRIRISSNQKQDLYRLVQVVGTSKVAEPYKVGKKTTDFLLEILNLNKTEVISIDIISNQDFTEDECKRLRQSIKCGLINRLTVGDIREKAIMLQEVRVKNWLEAEIERLSHLRDRASDMGRRKELRECVEKLQLLKSPEERQRRLEEIPEIHADPSMDPNCESEDEDETEEKEQDNHLRPKNSSFNRRGREPISPRIGGFGSGDSWSGTRNYSSRDRELSRNLSGRGFSGRGDTAIGYDERVNENLWSSGRDKETQHLTNSEKPRPVSVSETLSRSSQSVAAPELSSSKVVSEISPAPHSTAVSQSVPQMNESEKMWHYKDPSGKIQGPFSIAQLRKWNKAGYFPADLRTWKTSEKQEDSILLTDALAGKFQKQTPLAQTAQHSGRALSVLEIPKQDSSSAATNLPSPTPNQTTTPTTTKRRAFESRWSPTSVQTAVQSTKASVAQSVPSPASKPEISMLVSSAGSSEIQPQTMMSGDLQRSQQVNPHSLPAPNSANVSLNHPASVMTIPSPTHTSGNLGWGNSQSQKTNSGNSQNSSQTFGSGNPSGVFPAPSQSNFPQPDSWRFPVQNQPIVQASTLPNLHWGMNMSNNQSTTPIQAPANQNTGWGPMPVNPNVGWLGTVQPGTNMNWAASVPGSAQGNSNSSWVGPNLGQAQGYSHTGWGLPGQVHNWASPNQGSVPGNSNPNGSNQQAFWENQQNQNRDRFSNQRDGDSSGYGAGNAWNRQPSFGSGGSSGASTKGQRVCKFFRENGYCKKGASCDYLHN